MKTVFRADRGTLRRPERTPQGFLRVDGWVGRAGIYEYTNTVEDERDGLGKAGTVRRELRSDEVVFAANALAGFESAPITLGHPKGKVTPANVRAVSVGDVAGAARRDGDRVAATLVVKDAAAIKAVETGKQELSPGYFIDVEPQRGVDPKYGRYDAVQRNIVVNHLALVDRARGGSDLRLRMDGVEGAIEIARSDAQFDRSHGSEHLGGNMDPEEQLRSLKAQVAELDAKVREHETGAKTQAARADAAEARLITLTGENGELRAQIAAAATVVETEAIKREALRADAAEAKIREFDTSFKASVGARVTLERQAAVVMGPEFRMDGLSEREIRATVVKRLDASADTSTVVSDAFLAGRFESLVDLHARNARSQQRVGEIISTKNASRADELETERKAWRNEWQQPLPNSREARKGA